MARKVFVHAGTMKSATSYVQALCNCNVDVLAESGVLWTWSQTNFLATGDLLGTRHERRGLHGAWQALKGRIDDWDGDALISNEMLAEKTPAGMRTLVSALGPVEVHVVITARDLARIIPSQWQTGIRNRGTGTYDDFLRSLINDPEDGHTRRFWRKQDVAAIVRRFSRVVPLERISVVTVPPPGSDHTIVGERFATVLGVDAADFVQPPPVNASLGSHSVELLRRVNSRSEEFDYDHYRWAFKNGLARRVLAERARREPAIALTAEQLAWVRRRATSLVEDTAATGVRVVGDLADLIPANAAPAVRGHSEPTDGQLLDAAVDALVGMGMLLADLRLAQEDLVDLVEERLPPGVVERLRAERQAQYRDSQGEIDKTYLLNAAVLGAYLRGERSWAPDESSGTSQRASVS